MKEISDEDRSTNEEIERMIHDVRKIEVFVEQERDAKLGYALEELLSLRSLNKRLVEAGDKLADSVSAWMTQYKPESSIVQSINRNNMRTWDALMKEIGG